MGQQGGCGSGSCGCGGSSQNSDSATALMNEAQASMLAAVNGVPLHGAGESPDPEALRQRAYSELLRQAAQRAGLLAVGDLPALDGVLSEAASHAIEQLLARKLKLPEPDDAACQRFYAAHATRYQLVSARWPATSCSPSRPASTWTRYAAAPRACW